MLSEGVPDGASSPVHWPFAPDPLSEILKGELYLSDIDGAMCYEQLKANGIRHVISIGTQSDRDYEPYPRFRNALGIFYSDIDIADHDTAPIHEHFDYCNTLIHQAIQEKEPVLVHCLAGMSRSPTIVCAYLIAHRSMTAKEALAFVKGIRPIVRPNFGFCTKLHEFEKRMCRSTK